ncbi:MAG: hypothetical protein Q9160_009354 [Pyrenula sp. 1 TL-2023]
MRETHGDEEIVVVQIQEAKAVIRDAQNVAGDESGGADGANAEGPDVRRGMGAVELFDTVDEEDSGGPDSEVHDNGSYETGAGAGRSNSPDVPGFVELREN